MEAADSRTLYTVLVVLMAAGRLVELRVAKRNYNSLLARGGVEASPGHYRWMVLLHTAFLISCVAEVWGMDRPFVPWLGFPMLALTVLATGLRHPNYLAVIMEILALPLVHTAWITAVVFSVLNGLLLRVRIRAEEAALSRVSDYGTVFADRSRLIPGGR
jgi:methyltransferase